ncbi:hypothetical protein AB3331_00245 [Streptococcus sp. H49]|uniref:hypothetical protein n=1 Tax=Streptococcus huangxiaojuni TaxID=3237239 RepID=UPI0034A143CB
MIKEKRNKGFVANLVIGIIFLLIAVAYLVFTYYNTDISRIKSNNILYNGQATAAENGSNLVIDIYGIDYEPIADIDGHNTVLWLVAFRDGYVALEAKEDDKAIAQLIKKGDSLADNPEQLAVTYYNANYSSKEQIQNYSASLKGIMEEIAGPTSDLSQNFIYDNYVSLSHLQNDRQTSYIVGAIFGGLGLFFIVTAFFTKRRVNRAYDELYQQYPELNGNIASLAAESSFHDDSLQIVIYKHHLISYYQGLSLMNLDEIVQLYHHILTVRRSFIAVSRRSTLIGLKDNDKKQYRVPIKNIGKKTDDQLQATFNYLHEHFPHIQLGK